MEKIKYKKKNQVCVFYKSQFRECTFKDNNIGQTKGLTKCIFYKNQNKCPIWREFKALRGIK